MAEPLHEAYDVDVAKLNRLAAKSAERAESLKAENAKLEKRLAQYGLFREVVGDPAVEFANLRRELHRVERENEKLRELADAVKEFVEDTHCEDCPCRRDCDDNNRIFCANDFSYHAFAAMRELGIKED